MLPDGVFQRARPLSVNQANLGKARNGCLVQILVNLLPPLVTHQPAQIDLVAEIAADLHAVASGRRFLAVAEKYMMLRICSLVSLVAFVFGVLIFGHSSLKSENFKYLVKYIDKSPVLYSSFYEGIEYAGGENAKFGLYKGDVCVFDEGLLSLYGISGKNTLRSETGIGNAAVAIGKEHLCVYGGSSHELRIYNSFSMVPS